MEKKGLKLGGKYRIGKKLGAGAFGEVHLGKRLFHLDFLYSPRKRCSFSLLLPHVSQRLYHFQTWFFWAEGGRDLILSDTSVWGEEVGGM